MKLYYRLLAFVILFLTAHTHASAQTIPATDLTGFAWSSTIGWISLNCKNDNNCANSDYKVTINADRTVTGWAWSSNIGWIKFGGLSAFPTGGGTTAANASVSGTYPNLTFSGWARACAGTAAPNTSDQKNCTSMATNGNSGGWDGWISLRGTNYNVSANMTSGMNNNSYAWGDEVVGWLDMFTHAGFSAVQASLSGTGCTIPVGTSSCSARLTWNMSTGVTSPNIYNTKTSAQISTSRTQTNFATRVQNGTTTFQARSGTTMLATRQLSASCASGSTWSGGVCVADVASTTEPTITVRATPPIVRMGKTASVSWTISDLSGSTCVANGAGLNNAAINTTTGSMTTGAIRSVSTVNISCSGTYGEVEESVTVEVIPTTEEV